MTDPEYAPVTDADIDIFMAVFAAVTFAEGLALFALSAVIDAAWSLLLFGVPGVCMMVAGLGFLVVAPVFWLAAKILGVDD